MRETFNCYFLGAGYCMGCTGKKCNFKNGSNICITPGKRTFSMESTGINVSDTLDKQFGIKLFWYRKGNSLEIPLTKCSAFIFDREVNSDCFNKMILSINENVR